MFLQGLILQGRAGLERAQAAASGAEAAALGVAASVVDALSFASIKLRAMRIARALRLEARPSAAEWGASLLLGALSLSVPAAAFIAYDRILPAAGQDGAWPLALTMLGAAVLVVAEAGVRYARAHLADRAERTRETLRAARALAALAAAPLDGALEDGAPARSARLEVAADFIELRTGGLRRAVLDLPYAIVALLAAVTIGQWAALAPVALVLGVLVLFTVSSPWGAHASRARDAHDARGEDFIAECAAHLTVLKGAAMEPFFARRMEQLLASSRDHEWRRIRASDRAEDLASLLEAATVLAVAGLGGLMALQGGIGIGALVACILLGAGVVRPVVRIGAALQRAAALGPERELDEAEHESTPSNSAPKAAMLQCDAAVRGVAARICFEAPLGATIAFTARDGGAVSAVLRTLAGLDAPESGDALLAGVSVSTCRQAHPGAVALVTPRAVLLSGTVMDNLTLFGQGASTAQALAACDVLGLKPEIDRLPRRLDTLVGEGAGEDLSVSLAHRLCLARAIALSPRLLLLDEPQAGLDPAAERQLLAGLASLRGKMTIVLGASRPSWLTLADRAYTIDGDSFAPLAAAPTPRQSARRAGVK